MIAFSIPMQPSSKTPISALRATRSAARASACCETSRGMRTRSMGTTWLVSWWTVRVSSQALRCRSKLGLAKSSAQTVEYGTPDFVREPFRLSMPTSPGHCPDQLAAVRIGPVWVVSPGSTWLEYCHTASATTTGSPGSIPANTSSPSRALAMNPWPRLRDTA